MTLLGRTKQPGSKTWKTIPHLTLDMLKKATQPRENGQNDGSRNYPPAGSHQLAETEKLIVHEAEEYLKSVDDFANKEFADIARQAMPLSLAEVEDDFSDLKMRAKKECGRFVLQARPKLEQLRVDERRELRNLKLFKEQNGLIRLANYPESRIFHLAIILVCLAGEAGANTYFFAAGTDLGYLGGFMSALVVSLANLLFSFATGALALRYMHHVVRFKAVIGGCFLALWMGSMGVFHLLVAHYRDLLLIDPDHAMLGAWDSLRAAPFGLESMESYIVMIIGLVISLIFLMDGYSFDDVYPGYGKADREYKKKLAALNDAEQELRSDLVGAMDIIEEQADARLKKYEERSGKLNDLYEGAASVGKHFDNIYQQVDEIVGAAVNIYREANLRVRTDEAPASFSTMPQVKRLLDRDRYLGKIDELRHVKEESSARLRDMRRAAANIVNSMAEEVVHLGKKIDSLAEEVHERAALQIQRDSEEV